MGGLHSGKRHLCQYRLQIWCVQRSITLPEESRLSSVIPKRQGGSIFPDSRNEDVIREISPDTGKLLQTSTPARVNWLSSPIPDCIRTFGVLIAPSETTISQRAAIRRDWPSRKNSTPTACLPSNTTRVTSAPVSTVRLGRSIKG